MITDKQKEIILEYLIEKLELPELAYEKAESRYEDLGEWFDRDKSLLKNNSPHIFPQGSFRLGTAIRPLDENEEYDLDLACKLKDGVSKDTHTQDDLKELIGDELKFYRNYRGIKEQVESKHRCWRLEYKDDLSFHIDILPCIPADEDRRKQIKEAVFSRSNDSYLAEMVSESTINITDDRHPRYSSICYDWGISNPEGYSKWFEYRIKSNRVKLFSERAQIDDIPIYKQKTPLQRAIQLLKRHRDNMFRQNVDSKPISIIITTLVAKTYNGEQSIFSALENILNTMESFINPKTPRIPNPVDPNEDFADRWLMPQYIYLKLEENFFLWLKQAQSDFKHLISTTDSTFITEQAERKYSVKINASKLKDCLGSTQKTISNIIPMTHSIRNPSKLWGI